MQLEKCLINFGSRKFTQHQYHHSNIRRERYIYAKVIIVRIPPTQIHNEAYTANEDEVGATNKNYYMQTIVMIERNNGCRRVID